MTAPAAAPAAAAPQRWTAGPSGRPEKGRPDDDAGPAAAVAAVAAVASTEERKGGGPHVQPQQEQAGDPTKKFTVRHCSKLGLFLAWKLLKR